jgi:hypothetical protein
MLLLRARRLLAVRELASQLSLDYLAALLSCCVQARSASERESSGGSKSSLAGLGKEGAAQQATRQPTRLNSRKGRNSLSRCEHETSLLSSTPVYDSTLVCTAPSGWADDGLADCLPGSKDGKETELEWESESNS